MAEYTIINQVKKGKSNIGRKIVATELSSFAMGFGAEFIYEGSNLFIQAYRQGGLSGEGILESILFLTYGVSLFIPGIIATSVTSKNLMLALLEKAGIKKDFKEINKLITPKTPKTPKKLTEIEFRK